MHLLFSYGTLQQENVQMELFGKILHGFADVLHGYKTEKISLTDEGFDSNSNELFLIAVKTGDTSDSIRGIVLELSREELIKADAYEPEPYTRVSAVTDSGKKVWIYAKVPALLI